MKYEVLKKFGISEAVKYENGRYDVLATKDTMQMTANELREWSQAKQFIAGKKEEDRLNKQSEIASTLNKIRKVIKKVTTAIANQGIQKSR